ncbi:hypothetical protein M5K25_016488 [Dendrobium thyrsiflorum]|uniref:Uncharacterized protein n=1 Tax=Dendrobium thyrsiflorum TaxID=117978 RepID=A0ABD0URL9_DENTH
MGRQVEWTQREKAMSRSIKRWRRNGAGFVVADVAAAVTEVDTVSAAIIVRRYLESTPFLL